MFRARMCKTALSSLSLLLLMAPAAHASFGCDAINAGSLNAAIFVGINDTQSRSAASLAVGDRIDFRLFSPVGLGAGAQWWILADGQMTDSRSGVDGLTTHSHTVRPEDVNAISSTIRVQNGGSEITVTATCVAAVPDPGVSDSNHVADAQAVASAGIAQISAQRISGVVHGIIGNTFAGLSSSTVGPSGFTLGYAPTPRAPASPALDAALALTTPTPDWNVWADVQGSGWYGANTGTDQYGRQINLTAGMTYRLSPDMLVGAFAGTEIADYSARGGTLKAVGGTVGGYGAWQIMPGLRWDVLAAHSWLSYDAKAGLAAGRFGAGRWLASTALTGSVPLGVVTIEPSIAVQAMREDQAAWVDGLGAAHAARSFSSGTLSAGGRLIAPLELLGMQASIYGGTYADQGFAFGTPGALGAGALSARLTGGLNLPLSAGGSVTLGGQYGGIGSNTHNWSVSAAAAQSF